jgi:hypothetical protein
MKKLILKSLILSVCAFTVKAQGTDPAYFNLRKFYSQDNLGTARSQAMGGAFTALGGDLSNTYINPAGLGFYNRSEFSGTFNLLSKNTSANYIDTKTLEKRSPLDLGQLGAVFSSKGTGTRIRRGNFGISYSTLASFANTYNFSGINTSTSIADGFAELANAGGKSPQDIEKDYTSRGYAGTEYEMAYMAYIIEYDAQNGKYFPNELSLPVKQQGQIYTTGNLGQINLAYGANFDDKTYLGASLGIQSLVYSSEMKFDEWFENNPEFNSRLYYENLLTARGTGANLGVGVIHRINDNFNVGFNVTTPTLMKVTDSFQQYGGSLEVNGGWEDTQTGNDQLVYRVTSPLKANLGLSTFLPNRIGVISVEAEYVGYSNMNLKDKSNDQWSSSQKNLIQQNFRNVVNLKAGTEIRSGIARFRAGLNLINDPLKEAQDFNIKKNRVVGSLGAGIRNAKFFADLSISMSKTTEAYNPYALNTNEHYSVGVSQNRTFVGLTIGSFF